MIFLALAASASAVERHAYDPVLSLSGKCGPSSVSIVDEAEDPGCPADHPPKGFEDACGVATDSVGDIYVASAEIGSNGGRIDVFDPTGSFLTEISDPKEPCSISVDSEGNVYATEFSGKSVVMFAPKSYPPEKEVDAYEAPVTIQKVDHTNSQTEIETTGWSVAVDPSNDVLYVGTSDGISRYESAADGSGLIAKGIGGGLKGSETAMIAVYGHNHDIYVASTKPGITGPEKEEPKNARTLILDGAGAVQRECEVPGASSTFSNEAIAVDQSNGDIYVGDVVGHDAIYQLDAACHYIGQIDEPKLDVSEALPRIGIAIDSTCENETGNPCQTGYSSPNKEYVFAAQGNKKTFTSHLYAFAPREIGPPKIEGQEASEITETEAVLEAKLAPGGLDTRYAFEYITQSAYEANGYEGANVVPLPLEELSEGGSFVRVSEPIAGLTSGDSYRFRLVAENCAAEEAIEGECLTQGEGKPGEEGTDETFATFAANPSLPDNRAYELVTPPDTNGRVPTMSELSHNNEDGFDTLLGSPNGESVAFGVEGGSLPSLGGGGFHDTYEALRGPGGWQSHFTGFSAAQAPEPDAGGISPEHEYSFWLVENSVGSFSRGNYLRSPDGTFEPIGVGSLGKDLNVEGRWISSGGSHIVFNTTTHGIGQALRLEPCAPPSGIATIYDRSPDGPTKCVSLPPASASAKTLEEFKKKPAIFQGVAADGAAVAFEIAGDQKSEDTLYARLTDSEETVEVPDHDVTFGGISRDGGILVYLLNATARPNPAEPQAAGVPQGEIFAFDAASKVSIGVGTGDESALVYVSPSGSHIFFVSPQELNAGAEGEEAGAENLYAWDAGDPASTRFVAVLTRRDVEGRPAAFVNATMTNGLGLWVNNAVNPQREENHGLGADPARGTPDGSVLVFESRAQLTEYDNAGHAEVYRFSATAPPEEALLCVSCNPTGGAATSDASLQTPFGGQFVSQPPTNALARIQNVTDDGKRIFFQSSDRLASGDVDGKQDIYEWEAEGNGNCERQGGCIYPISSGRSASNDYIYATTPDGSDVFFETGDTLVRQDIDATPSIYDARSPHVPGEAVGFPEQAEPPTPCLGEACQAAATAPPALAPASSSFDGAGNSSGRKPCPRKGAARNRRQAHCAKRHKRHRKAHRSHGQPHTGRTSP